MRYPYLSQGEQVRNIEQDFYCYLNSVFFQQPDSYYAIWEEHGRYLTAVRIEPYTNGLLLCGLETLPQMRRRGYATSLMRALMDHLRKQGRGTLYSHVSKINNASLSLQLQFGFQIIEDYAILSDASVSHSYYTLRYKY